MKCFTQLFVLALLSPFVLPSLRAQRSPSPCKEMKYEHHNMIDYGPLRISAVRGIAKDFQGFAASDACVGIFSETDHMLVATAQTDSKGLFEIRGVPDGRYVLIVASEFYCAANVSVILRGRSHVKKRLLATIKLSAFDVCSYVEWK